MRGNHHAGEPSRGGSKTRGNHHAADPSRGGTIARRNHHAGESSRGGPISRGNHNAGEPSRGGTIMRRKHQAGEPSHGRTVTRGHLAHGGIILRGDLLHREHTQEVESTRGRETDLAEPQKPRGDYVQKKREVDDVAVWLGGPRNFPANSQDHQQEAQAILVGRRPGGRGCSVCSGARGRCGTRAAPWCGADAARVAGRGRPGVRWTTGMCTAHPGRTRRCATTLPTTIGLPRAPGRSLHHRGCWGPAASHVPASGPR